MLERHGLVLVFTQCPQFYPAVQAALARENISVVAVNSREQLVLTIREEGPAAVLIDWDSIGRETLPLVSFLKSGSLKRAAQIAVVTKSGHEAPSQLAVLASGADDFIDLSAGSECFSSQVHALIRWQPIPASDHVAHAV